jgi:hypothetical protein
MNRRKLLICMMTAVFLGAVIILAGARFISAEESGPVILARGGDAGEEDIETEDDFWTIFRRLFVAEEPKYEDEVYHTEVAGVRGIEREGEMDTVYDFDSVRWMEEFQVKPEQVKSFLEGRELGPYQKKGEGRKS